MELKKYFYPLIRWWWLLLAATLVAAIASFLVTLQQPPIFQSSTTLMIGRAIADPNPSSNEFWLGQQLAASYADMASRETVRNATMTALGMDWLPPYKVQALSNSQLIEIDVTDTDPARAQAVASALAEQLILLSPTGARPDEQSRREFVTEQLDALETQIKQTNDEILKRQTELGNMVSARQINDTQNQIAALQTKLTTLQDNYARLLSNTQGGAVNTLTVIEPAALPKNPVGPARAIAVLVAALIGFALAAAAAYLLEYLDDSLKDPQEIQNLIGHPVLGAIFEHEEEKEDEVKQPYVALHPRSPMAEAYRTLRTNLDFSAVDSPLKTLLVTSPDAEDGKTSVALNLAVMMAQSDKRVVIIDADLRRPSVHEYMEMSNESGLSDVFRGRDVLTNTMKIWKNEKIAVVTGGSPPPNPTELLGSKKMDQILENLKEVADIVIIDGPPFLVADAAVLSAKVDGVLVVVRPGYTHKTALRAMMDQINRAGARVVGVVLNRIPLRIASYYSGIISLYPYYAENRYVEKKQPASGVQNQHTVAAYSQRIMNFFRPSPKGGNAVRRRQ